MSQTSWRKGVLNLGDETSQLWDHSRACTKAAVTAFADGLRMEIRAKHNIRVTCIQPGAVKSELYDHITDADYREQMDDLAASMTFLEGEDIAHSILFALKSPARMDVAELFVLPTEQGWEQKLIANRA